VPLKEGIYSTIGSIPIELTHADYYNIDTTGQYNLLVTANSEYYTRAEDLNGLELEDLDKLRTYFLNLWEGYTEKQIAESGYLRLDKSKIDPERLPMSGKAVKTAGSQEVNVILERCVSRLDVELEDNRYELISAAVYNVFSRTNVWDNIQATYQDDKYIYLNSVEAKKDENFIRGQLYAFENYVPSPQQNDEVTTCLIVELKRKEGSRQNEFFRINMHPPKRMQQLKRNKTYSYVIRKVLGDGTRGDDGREKAYANPDLLIDGDINGWEKEKFGDIVFDSDNILAISFASVYFSPQEGIATVDIFTHGPGELEIGEVYLPANITVKLKDKKLIIDAKESEDEQQGKIQIKFAGLNTWILIEQRKSEESKIQLSHQVIDAFSPFITEPDSSQRIKVTATGDWIAKLYNNPENKFSFDKDDNALDEITVEKPEDYITVYVHNSNTTDKACYSFVMFSLVNNPTVSQVLLLTQPIGKIKLSDHNIAFTPEGKVLEITSQHYYDIQVELDETFEWDSKVMRGDGFFKYEKKDNTLRVVAERDSTGQYKQAEVRVYVKGNLDYYETITITQDAHSISVNPETGFATVPPEGGPTKYITVTATGAWTASMQESVTKRHAKLISDASGFYVDFPRVSGPFIEPKVTVTIAIEGTTVQKKLNFEQSELQPIPINLDSWGNNNIGLNTNGHFSPLSNNLRNQGMFGTNGIVKIPEIKFSGIEKGPFQVKQNTHIYQTGAGYRISLDRPENITEEHAKEIKKWLTGFNRIYFFMQDVNAPVSIENLIKAKVLPESYKGKVKTFDREKSYYYDVDFPELENNPLMSFLLEKGPFKIYPTGPIFKKNKFMAIGGIVAYITDAPE
ncbi:MAG: hypothetical protein LIP01_09745, partial [Tannerellaceae bacterium]|nr:hypothetical protein [Tannerellaceae bacterium]